MKIIKDSLKDFCYYKELILKGKTNGGNIIIEQKDGEYRVSRLSCLKYEDWSQIERMTVFNESTKKEYEFVVCQGVDD